MGGRSDRARVFISCGQAKGTEEVQIADAISARLRELGFDPYVAVAEQTLRGLTENIFEQLKKSEYFLFVDFKREQLGTTPDHRGSLFSHQELAIAAFINIEVAAFQEAGVKVGDGLIHFLQANAIQFSNRTGLPALIIENIQRRGWNSSWRRELVIKRVPQQYTESKERLLSGMMVDSRFFHIDVHNLHKEKLATNCYVYLEKAKRLPDTEIPIKTTEFKWAGVGFPGVAIMPRSTRAFDAFHIRVAEPTQIIFNALTDSSDFYPKLPKGPAKYELTYIIVAENFPPDQRDFHLGSQRVDWSYNFYRKVLRQPQAKLG